MGTGPEGHECRGGEDGGGWTEEGKPPRNQAIVPDRSQRGVSILTVGMILRGDPLLPPAGSVRHLSGETEEGAMAPAPPDEHL